MRPFGLLSIALVVVVCHILYGRESASPDRLRQMASEYYSWRNQNYPVASSEEGLHSWDDSLTDYSEKAIAARRQHVNELLSQVRAMPTETWSRDDRIDWLLFRAQLERETFWGQILKFEDTNP